MNNFKAGIPISKFSGFLISSAILVTSVSSNGVDLHPILIH